MANTGKAVALGLAGVEFYLFKVPPTTIEEWRELPYVQPDELLDYAVSLDLFLSRAQFKKSSNKCGVEGCGKMAISGMRQCLLHHIEGLQRIGNLHPFPAGRWFSPYDEESFQNMSERIGNKFH